VVLHQEHGDVEDERHGLLLWVSMLKERTTSEKVRAQVRERHLNTREELLERQWAAIDDLDDVSQKILSDAKELYATAEAWANTTIKQEELVMCIHVLAKREQAVEELEQRLQEREGLDDIKLGRELEAFTTRASSLDNCEATLEVGQKSLEDTDLRVMVMSLLLT
jgi:threonyl-tRNA synthetase